MAATHRNKLNWTKEEDELLIKIGNSKGISKIMSEDFPHRTKAQLFERRRLLGISIKKAIPFANWEVEIIKTHYQKADKIEDFMHLLRPGRPWKSVAAYANQKLGLKKRIEYQKNRTYFDIPNIENCSLAGLVASDGNVYKNRLVVKLSYEDHAFLCKFRDMIGYCGPIQVKDVLVDVLPNRGYNYPKRYSKRSNLHIACSEYPAPLEKHWNIVPAKSLILKAPKITNYEQCLAYMTGLINGDGSVSLIVKLDSRLKKTMVISLNGTSDICQWMKFIVDLLCPFSRQKLSCITKKKNSKIYAYAVGGARATVLAREILKMDGRILLMDRKWDNAKNYIKEQESIEQYMLTKEVLEKNAAHIEQNRHTFEESISQYVKSGLLPTTTQ